MITAIAIRQVLSPGQLVFADFPGDPMKAGEIRKINGFRDYGGPLEVAAVVFDDGTTKGNAIDAFNGEDVITEIFNGRQARASEWANGKALLDEFSASESRAAILAFIDAARAIRIGENRNTVDGGHIMVQEMIKNLARDADRQLAAEGACESSIR